MDEVWQEFLQQVLLNLVPILVPLVIAWVGKMAVGVWQDIKNSQPKLAWYLTEAAEFAVNAAEQVGLSGALENYADSKLDYAIQVAEKYLATNGIKHVDLSLLRAAIEAEVKKANFPHKNQIVEE